MSKLVKQLLADEMRQTFGRVDDLVFLDINRLNGIENNEMRLALRSKQIHVRIVRNRLAKRVFDELGLGPASRFLQGPSAIAWGAPSIVELAKEITAWTQKLTTIQIKGGLTGGTPLSPQDIRALSRLPSYRELIGRIVSLALGPAARVAALTQSPGARVRGQLKSMADKS